MSHRFCIYFTDVPCPADCAMTSHQLVDGRIMVSGCKRQVDLKMAAHDQEEPGARQAMALRSGDYWLAKARRERRLAALMKEP